MNMNVTTKDQLEELRFLGKQLGYWDQGYRLRRDCELIVGHTQLKGKSFLEIGCGRGVNLVYASVQGAEKVLGLEPLDDGAEVESKTFENFGKISHYNLLGPTV